MKQRLISAFVGIIVFVLVLLGGEKIFCAAAAVITEIGLYEMFGALGIRNHKTMCFLSFLFPVVFNVLLLFTEFPAYMVIYIYLLALLITMLFGHREYSFSVTAHFFASTVMISVAFSYLSLLRVSGNGLINVILVFIGSWITDSCAYFAGRFLGKHKLAPEVSPKKTIEGSVGGVLGTALFILLYVYLAGKYGNVGVNYVSAAFVGIICGIISQIGDLCASLIKREHNIKDYGNIMPGHGGVMDRFDSVLFVAPAVYFFIYFIPVFVSR